MASDTLPLAPPVVQLHRHPERDLGTETQAKSNTQQSEILNSVSNQEAMADTSNCDEQSLQKRLGNSRHSMLSIGK